METTLMFYGDLTQGKAFEKKIAGEIFLFAIEFFAMPPVDLKRPAREVVNQFIDFAADGLMANAEKQGDLAKTVSIV
jgi:hypothetical protein